MENKKNVYFVYCFLDPRKPGNFIYDDYIFDFEPMYVGKGKGNRPKRHFTLYKTNNTRFYSKMKSIIDSGYIPKYIYLKDKLCENDSLLYEKKMINNIGRIENGGKLTNLTDGGEGISGLKMSEETKLKMSKIRLGKKMGKMSEETKLKISISKIGSLSPMKGKTHTIESKNKMSLKAKQRTGEKNSMYNKHHSIESKIKMSENTIKKIGKDNPNFERKYKESEKTFDSWKLFNNDGNVVIIHNLNKFCREQELNASCMRDIYYGRMKKHKGWINVVKLTNNIKKKEIKN